LAWLGRYHRQYWKLWENGMFW